MSLLTAVVAVVLNLFSWASPAAPATRSNVVGFVGDSITAFNLPEIQRRLDDCGAPPVTFDALSGRQAIDDFVHPVDGVLPSGSSAVERIEQNANPSVWVFEIGVNDMHDDKVHTFDEARALIAGVLSRIDATDTVYWVNTWSVYAPEWPAFNAALRADERITVLDWATHAPYHTSDGVHPDAAGVQILSDMYCDALTGSRV